MIIILGNTINTGFRCPTFGVSLQSPYIVECPVNFECTLWRIVNCGSHDLVLGEIQQVHIDEPFLNDDGNALDPYKFDPLVSLQMEYWDIGRNLGKWGGLWRQK